MPYCDKCERDHDGVEVAPGVVKIAASDVDDARRFRVLLKDPVGARHLLHLLQQGKGDEAAFRSMIDRIDQSARGSTVAPTAEDR